MWRVGTPVQTSPRRLSLQFQVEPRIQVRIEPRLCGRENMWRMRGDYELETGVTQENRSETAQ